MHLAVAEPLRISRQALSLRLDKDRARRNKGRYLCRCSCPCLGFTSTVAHIQVNSVLFNPNPHTIRQSASNKRCLPEGISSKSSHHKSHNGAHQLRHHPRTLNTELLEIHCKTIRMRRLFELHKSDRYPGRHSRNQLPHHLDPTLLLPAKAHKCTSRSHALQSRISSPA
jgi:hypothetical protein